MGIFNMLTLAEQAKQLSNPEGSVGLEVANWLSENNKQGYAEVAGGLGIKSGDRVLEIGFGNGRAVPYVIDKAPDIHYAGIDISPIMVEEATRFNTNYVAVGRAGFYLAGAEQMPFNENSFERVFSVGVIHFWSDPITPLREVRRVLCPGGSMLMGCLAPREAPGFARQEYGIYLRDAGAWKALCRDAGFETADAAMIESQQITPAGTEIKRYTMRVTARA